MNKNAVITGGSSGFGLLTGVKLAELGYHVIAVFRDKTKIPFVKGYYDKKGLADLLTIRIVDLAHKDDLKAFTSELKEMPSLDVLINNAGFAAAGFVEEISIEELKAQFEVNFFAAVELTKAILPIMRKQQNGKIINISSISGQVGFPGLSAYASSKFALEGFSESLRLEMKPFGVDVILIEPGSYNTNIWTSGKKPAQAFQSVPAYKDFHERLSTYLSAAEQSYGNPEEVAALIVKVCESAKPQLRYVIGKGSRLSLVGKAMLPWRRWERLVMKVIFK